VAVDSYVKRLEIYYYNFAKTQFYCLCVNRSYSGVKSGEKIAAKDGKFNFSIEIA
jgi:hypothetical protein